MGNLLFENGIHEATLQRLGTYLKNGAKDVFYSPESFNPARWDGIPVIYADVQPGQPLRHPSQEAVNSGNLPPGYSAVGKTRSPVLTEAGEPALKAQIEFTDPGIEIMANGGELSLSTGFTGGTVPETDGRHRLVGETLPNHVLVFKRGACPNCFPNDNGAVFHNCVEEVQTMTDEGFIKQMKEFFTNSRTEIQVENAAAIKAEMETLKAENAALLSRFEESEKARIAQEAEHKWQTFRNASPAGWLGDKEADTRKAFESDPVGMALKLIQFNNALPPEKRAEGKEMTGEQMTAENAAEAEIAEFQKAYKIRFIGDD